MPSRGRSRTSCSSSRRSCELDGLPRLAQPAPSSVVATSDNSPRVSSLLRRPLACRRRRCPRTRPDLPLSFLPLTRCSYLVALASRGVPLVFGMSGSSSAASPATAPAFPKVGDTFPSLLAFKLACHRAACESFLPDFWISQLLTLIHAVASGIELKIKTGDANRADMRCRLGERATVNKVMDGPCCSFQIAVYKSFVEANGGDFRVNKRNLVHSCPLEVRQQRRSSGDTAQWSRGKIKEFEYALRKEEAPVRSPAARKQRRGEGGRSEANKDEAASLSPRDGSAGRVGGATPLSAVSAMARDGLSKVGPLTSRISNLR